MSRTESKPSSKIHPPSRWKGRLLLILASIGLLIGFLPNIIAKTPVLGMFVGHANSLIKGRLSVGSASLSWFAPAEFRDIELVDGDGATAFVAESVKTERSLFALVTNRDDLGVFTITRPTVELRLIGGNTNWEKILEPVLSKPAEASHSSAPLPKVGFVLTDGSVRITDAYSKQHYELEQIQIRSQLFQDPANPIQAHVQSTITDGTTSGSVDLTLAMKNESEGELKGKLSLLPLKLISLFLSRAEPGLEVGGFLNGQCQGTWRLNGKTLQNATFEGEVGGQNLMVVHPSLQETLVLDMVKAPCKLELKESSLVIHKAELACDLGQASVRGAVDLKQSPMAAFQRPDQVISAQLDLARIVTKLPKTVSLHPDLRVLTGQLKLTCQSVAKDDSIAWEGNLQTTELRGMKGTQVVSWPEPVAVAFKVRPRGSDFPLIDLLRCESGFLKIQGSSDSQQFALKADLELEKLTDPLSRFVDLGSLKLAGVVSATFTAKQLDPERYEFQGTANGKQLLVALHRQKPFQEPAVTVQYSGAVRRSRALGLEKVVAMAQLGAESVSLSLATPIPDLSASLGTWDVKFSGDLAQLQKRLKPFTTALDGVQASGAATVQTRVAPSGTTIDIPSAHVQVKGVRLVGAGLNIINETLDVRTTGLLDLASMHADLRGTQIVTQAAKIDSPRMSADLSKGAIDGDATLTGDLAKVMRWTQGLKGKSADSLLGSITGSMKFRTTGSKVDIAFDGGVKNFVIGDSVKPLWKEADVRLVLAGAIEPAADLVQVASIKLDSQLASLSAAGKVANVSGSKVLDLNGNVTYDLAKVEPYFKQYLGSDLKVEGRDTRAFLINGPLYSTASVPAGVKVAMPATEFTLRDVKGQAGLGWGKLQALGCEIGKADIRAIMQKGWVQVYPVETTLNGGKLTFQPNIRLEPGPMFAVLSPGAKVDRAQITPKMCASAMGFALPLLAKAAEADGAVSLQLENAQAPLTNPLMAEVKGSITLHHAKIGPGPMVKQFSSLFQTPPVHFLVKECKVPVQMMQGKIYHQGLEVNFGEMWMRTSGWVGVDGKMEVVAEMPVPQKLLAGVKVPDSLKKHTLKVPIAGTVDQPRLDMAALMNQRDSLIRNVGGDFIRGTIEDRLNNFLKKKLSP